MCCKFSTPSCSIQGTAGEIVVDGFGGGCRSFTPDPNGQTAVAAELCREGWDAGYAGEWLDFAAACLDSADTQGPAAEAAADLRVVRAMFEAAEARQWVDVSPPPPS